MSYNDERDSFWDIEKLVPKKKTVISPFSTNRSVAVEVQVKGDEKPTYTKEDRQLTKSVSPKAFAEGEEYYPDWNPLIKRVIVSKFNDKYDFYDSFRKSAILYYDVPGVKSPFVKFYSYMPQYSQMNSAQKNYYFYWRSELRAGRYLETDYSYLYLFVYEILNLPDKIPSGEGIKLLCKLWREYRVSLPRIDLYFSIWVQDYCMIYRLPSPTEYIKDFLYSAVSVSSFKEFYLSDIERSGSEGASILLAFLSDYDWRAGKYAGGENKEDYRRHMEGAMRPLLSEIRENFGKGEPSRIFRDAFPNSLCTHSVKSRLEIEYYPLASEKTLRSSVTAAVRYTENKIRALLGVKSRLGVKDLPDKYRILIDCYFDRIFKEEKRQRQIENTPEYMKLYEPKIEEMSFLGADEIEKSSWSTTARLVEEAELEDCTVITDRQHEADNEKAEQKGDGIDTYGLSLGDISFIAGLLGVDCKSAVSSDGVDSIAERVNEAFFDGFGDVVLEPCDDGYSVIADYESELREWLMNLLK